MPDRALAAMTPPFDQTVLSLPQKASDENARPTPSLLPAFEPTSSSPAVPRPLKRKFDASPCHNRSRPNHYPTPVPTSSTGVLPSSPPHFQSTRPSVHRSMSERVPLGALASVEVPANGEAILMGRSSNSSHYQLAANRLISRVHVRAIYNATKGKNGRGEVLLECVGWNGVTVHCQGKMYELRKEDTFSSDQPGSEIMLDVQGARVLVKWPQLAERSASSSPDMPWDEDDSPLPPRGSQMFGSSPPVLVHLQSPVSPSPVDRLFVPTNFLGLSSSTSPIHPSVEVYEDKSSDNDENVPPTKNHDATVIPKEESPDAAQRHSSEGSSSLSEVDSFSDNDEENDPIVHSFGPFGANLQSRMESVTTGSPTRPTNHPPSATKATVPKSESTFRSRPNLSPVRNHVINQLAFSRLHSLPLSTIMTNLPSSLKGGSEKPSTTDEPDESGSHLTEDDLQTLLEDIPCVGEIAREGRDAAGKPLENEYYYIPEGDADEMRRNAVQEKPGLRAVRKQHKQYYWKRPRA